MSHGFFVTGTDTGVGKTRVSCALLHALAARGLRAVGMKPIAAGAESIGGRLVNEDVAALTSVATVRAPDHLVNPYCLQEAIAPHIAAEREGVAIELGRIESAYLELAGLAQYVVVEGAGGFLVPLGRAFDTADLASALRLPVLIVVGMRLGCLNHALLTAAAVRAAGLAIAGWVANHIDADMLCPDENVAALADRMGAPLVARIAYSVSQSPAETARAIDVERLIA